MKPTPWGALAWSTVGGLFLAAFALGAIAPALGAVTLAAGLEAARVRLRTAPVQVTREHPRSAPAGRSVRVRTTATAAGPLRIDDDGVRGLRVTGRHATKGPTATSTVEGVPEAPGILAWRDVHVAQRDPWGLHESIHRIRAPSRLTVAPEPTWSQTGARAGRKHPVRTTRRAETGLIRDLDIEGVRDYTHGDRVRDIDWAHSSKMQTLQVREREPIAPRGVHIVLDGGTAMRWHLRGSRAASAARLAEAVAAAVRTAGARAHFHVLGDKGLHPSKRPDLGDAVPVAAIPAPLQSQQAPRDWTRPLLAKRSRDIIVAIMDAEWDPRSVQALIVESHRTGRDAVVVGPSIGRHHYTRRASRDDLARLRIAMENRLRVARLARERGVPFLVLHPDNIEETARQVMQCIA